ncbi:hypothetical protein ACJX0J_030259 [Zea mays]
MFHVFIFTKIKLGAFFILSDNLYSCLFIYSGDGLSKGMWGIKLSMGLVDFSFIYAFPHILIVFFFSGACLYISKKLLWGNKKSNPSEEIGFSEYMTLFRIINRIMNIFDISGKSNLFTGA